MTSVTGTMIGSVVQSTAGHDAGSLYVVVGIEHDILLLSDGRLRRVNRPKRKKRIHAHVKSDVSAECRTAIEDSSVSDSLLRRELSAYRRRCAEHEPIYERRDSSAKG